MMTLERAEEILMMLNISKQYDEADVIYQIKNLGLEDEVLCAGGVSKICLVFLDADFVFKYSNPYSDSDGDEAEREVENYNRAVELGIEMFFPKTYLYGKINGINIVYQEKIDYCVDSAWHYQNPKQTYNLIHSINIKDINAIREKFNIDGIKYNRVIDTIWLAFVLAIYKKEVINKLIDFIQEKKINDLHGENLGYKNNKPIILDFSGYYC